MPKTRIQKEWLSRFEARHDQSNSPLLLGRMDSLEELFDSIESPESAILVVGIKGSGRTTILHELHDDASTRSVWLSPHPLDSAQPFASVSRSLNAIGDRRLSQFLSGLSAAEPTFESALAVASDLVTLLRAAQCDDLLVVIDDADELDESSQLVFAYLAGQLDNTGLRLVMSVAPPATFGLFAGIKRVWMSRLDATQSMELAQSVAPYADEQTLAMVCEASGGLPGMISGAIAVLTTDQLEGNAPLVLPLYPGPGSTAATPWDPASLALLQRLSIAPLTSLAALNDILAINHDPFERLVSQGVLQLSGQFVSIRDGAMRSSIYWSMSSTQRDELHATAAEAEKDHDTGLTYWHLDHGRDGAPKRKVLLDAASTFFGQGLVSAATEFVERTLLLNPVPEEMFPQLLALCHQLMGLSEFRLAGRYLRVCRRAAVKRKQEAECLPLEITIATLAEEPVDPGIVDVYAQRYRKDNPRTSAELLSVASTLLAHAGDIDAARHRVESAYEIFPAHRVTTDSTQYWTRRFIDAIDGRGTGPMAKDDRQPDAEELSPTTRLVSGRALMLEENYDRARMTFNSLAMDAPKKQRGIAWSARILVLSAQSEIRAGNVAEASRIIEALAGLGLAPNIQTLLLFAWNNGVALGRGEASELVAEAQRRANLAHQPVLATQLLAFDGTLALIRGDIDGAAVRLTRAYDRAQGIRPDYLRLEGDLVEALARRGDWDAARRVTARFAERAAQFPSTWTNVVLARCQAIVAPKEELIAKFASAVELAKRRSATLELARTRMNFALALDSLGQGQRASDQRQSAEYTFESLSAAGWVAAIRDSVRAIEQPLQASLLSTLTESELAVLRLMHKGVRNKDIAAALFVSLRTVEVRITQIYRKLEARSRSHLLTLLPTELDQIDSL